jgi:hypothetical protein
MAGMLTSTIRNVLAVAAVSLVPAAMPGQQASGGGASERQLVVAAIDTVTRTEASRPIVSGRRLVIHRRPADMVFDGGVKPRLYSPVERDADAAAAIAAAAKLPVATAAEASCRQSECPGDLVVLQAGTPLVQGDTARVVVSLRRGQYGTWFGIRLVRSGGVWRAREVWLVAQS